MPWREVAPEFADVPLQPGDRLEHKTTTATALFFVRLRMTELEVHRTGAHVATYRSNAILFWIILIGLPLAPLALWLVGAGLLPALREAGRRG